MVLIAVASQNIQVENLLNLLAGQGFADNITLVTHVEKTFRNMVSIAESIMAETNLKLNFQNVSVFYSRKSGNNWYNSNLSSES